MSKLDLHNVSKIFGTNRVLDGVSLSVGAGEVVSLIGPSGSGKSTLLRCINLLETVDEGAVLFDGVDISLPGYDANQVRRRIGIVFQSFNLFPHMTVADNINLAPRKVLGTQKADARQKVLELLSRFNLADKADAYPDQLSGGQQQRVAIVRALALQPEVILLDEVTSALDPELVGEVLDVISELKAAGMTMILATHEMSFARHISDTVCVLDKGSIIERGSPADIFSNPQEERTRQFLSRISR